MGEGRRKVAAVREQVCQGAITGHECCWSVGKQESAKIEEGRGSHDEVFRG
jgi:hypothetical protein